MMRRIVVDSSVIVKWLNRENEERLEVADQLLQSALDGRVALLAPGLAEYEVGNVLLTAKKLSAEQGREVMELLCLLPIQFVRESRELAYETFRLGVKSGVTFYDAAFGALAKQEGAILVTDNPKHQVKIEEVSVISLGKYK